MPRQFGLIDQVSPVQAVHLNIIGNANRYGVISGCDLTWNNNLTVTVAAGELLVDGQEVEFSEETFTLTSQRPTGTSERWVMLTADSSGAGERVDGVAEVPNAPTTYPKLPALPDGNVAFAAVLLRSGDSSLSAVDAANRAVDLRVAAPTARGITGLDLNEEGDVLLADEDIGSAWETIATLDIAPSDDTDKVWLRLGLWVELAAGEVIEYRVRRGNTTILDAAELESGDVLAGGPTVAFPFLDEPATTDATTYTLQARETGTGTPTVKKGSFLYAREVHV